MSKKIHCPFCARNNVHNNMGGMCECGAEYWLSPDTDTTAIIAKNLAKPGQMVAARPASRGFVFFKSEAYVPSDTPRNIVQAISSEQDFPFLFSIGI